MISDGLILNGEDDNGIDDEEQEDSDVKIKIVLPRKYNDRLINAIVNRRKLDDKGKDVGVMNNKPLLDTRAYEEEFDDGTNEVLTVRNIADNLLAQVNEEVHHQMILD